MAYFMNFHVQFAYTDHTRRGLRVLSALIKELKFGDTEHQINHEALINSVHARHISQYDYFASVLPNEVPKDAPIGTHHAEIIPVTNSVYPYYMLRVPVAKSESEPIAFQEFVRTDLRRLVCEVFDPDYILVMGTYEGVTEQEFSTLKSYRLETTNPLVY